MDEEMMSIQTVHRRLRDQRGPASDYQCVSCDNDAREWAYQFTCDAPLYEGTAPYSENPDDYAPMCRSCHLRLDAKHGFRGGDTSRKNAVKARAALASRDDEFLSELYSRAGRLGGQALAKKIAGDPVLAERRSRISAENVAKANAMGRRCVECGHESTPGGIGVHQHYTGHEGREDVE